MKALWSIALAGAALAGRMDAQPTRATTMGQVRLGSGTQLPAHCELGQVFLNTANDPGGNVFVCTAADAWTRIGAGFTAGLGLAVTGSVLGVEDAVVPTYFVGAGAPTVDCVTGRDFFIDTTAPALYFCKGVNLWQAVSSAGHTHAAEAIASGQLADAVLPTAVARRNQANSFSAGQRQSMGHDGNNAGLRLLPTGGDPSGALDGDVWYNSTTGKFRRRQNGTLLDWDGAGGISLTQSNTYAAGQRQSMGHDATQAGLRLIPAAGDPASAQDGDLWYNLTTGKFRRRQNGANSDWDATGGGGSAFDSNDATSFWMVEEFPSRLFNSSSIGSHGWYLESIGAGGCASVGVSNGLVSHPGIIAFAVPNTANAGCDLTLDAGGDTRMLGNLAAMEWQAKWTFVPDNALATANFVARIGIGATAYSIASLTGWMARIDPSISTIRYDLYTAGTLSASIDSGIVYDPNASSYTFKLRGDGVRWHLSTKIGSGAYSAEKSVCPSGCDGTATVPTSGVSPFLSLTHGPASDGVKRLYVDRFSIQVAGLSR